MLDNIIGSIFFEFIGALTKWLFYAAVYALKGKKIKSFKVIWDGRKGSTDSDLIMHGASNILLGLIITVALVLIIIQINRRYF